MAQNNDCGSAGNQRSSSRQTLLQRAIDCNSNPIVWENIAKLGDANPPGSEHIESTEVDRDSCSGENTYVTGITYNDFDATINWEAHEHTHKLLENDHRNGRTWLYRFVIPFNNGNMQQAKYYRFKGRVKTWSPQTPVDGNPTSDLSWYVDDDYGLKCGFLSPNATENCFSGC